MNFRKKFGDRSNRNVFTIVSAILFVLPVVGQEICTNGLDDDGDGLIDLNDLDDCTCSGIQQTVEHLADPSFEELTCFPQTENDWSCSVEWTAGTGPTTDLFHQDGYWFPVIPVPLPGGGQACAGMAIGENYREYLGTCLAVQLSAGVAYEMSFHIFTRRMNLSTFLPLGILSPISMTVYGSSACPTWPVLATCPGDLTDWIPIGSVVYSPTDEWSLVELQLQSAQDINAIQVGAPCGILAADYSFDLTNAFPYFFMDEFSITHLQPIILDDITETGNLCSEDLVLSIEPPSTGITSMQWFHEGVAISGANNESLTVTGPGVYQFVCWSGSECAMADHFVPETLFSPSMHMEIPVCAPAELQLNMAGIPTDAQVTWSLNNGPPISGNDVSVPIQHPGIYDVSGNVLFANGCAWDTIATNIYIQPGPEAAFDHVVDVDLLGHVMIHVNDLSTGDVVDRAWSLQHDLESHDAVGTNASFDLGMESIGPVDVMLIVVDDAGCTDTVLSSISWELPITLHIPNSFTPNNDGINDQWGLTLAGEAIQEAALRVYDRGGQLIWHSERSNVHWDGNVSGSMCPDGIYQWILEIADLDSVGRQHLSGHVTLLR